MSEEEIRKIREKIKLLEELDKEEKERVERMKIEKKTKKCRKIRNWLQRLKNRCATSNVAKESDANEIVTLGELLKEWDWDSKKAIPGDEYYSSKTRTFYEYDIIDVKEDAFDTIVRITGTKRMSARRYNRWKRNLTRRH